MERFIQLFSVFSKVLRAEIYQFIYPFVPGKPNSRDWHTRQFDITDYVIDIVALALLGALFSWVLGAFLIENHEIDIVALVLSGGNILWIFGFFLFVIYSIGYLIYDIYRIYNKLDHEYLVTSVGVNTSQNIVTNVLDNKNLPFIQIKKGFLLEEENLVIEFGNYYVEHYGGSSISIGPIDDENYHIAESLKRKIKDDYRLPSSLG